MGFAKNSDPPREGILANPTTLTKKSRSSPTEFPEEPRKKPWGNPRAARQGALRVTIVSYLLNPPPRNRFAPKLEFPEAPAE